MNEHVLRALMNFKPAKSAAWAFATEERKQRLIAQITHFPATALPDLDNPTILCGIVFNEGVGELWMLAGEGFRRTAPIVLMQAKQLLPNVYEALQLHRLSLHVAAGTPGGGLWAKRLGFEYETTLKRAHRSGKDLEIYLWPDSKEQAHHVH